MRSTPSLRSFPNVALWNSSNVRPTNDGPFSSFKKEFSSSASPFHACLRQALDGVMFLALCPQVVSQAPQHFRSSETQATCDGCFARQSICSVISLQPNDWSFDTYFIHPLNSARCFRLLVRVTFFLFLSALSRTALYKINIDCFCFLFQY